MIEKNKLFDEILDYVVEMYDLYMDLCPKKWNGKPIFSFYDFVHMIGTIDNIYTFLDHVLHLENVSIIRNLNLWITYLSYKAIQKKGDEN